MDKCIIFAHQAGQTTQAGTSLSKALYSLPLTILIRGQLGAGKTTFVQGLATGLGVDQAVTSPTYALEQRYPSARGTFLHLDLYRLSPADAAALVHSTADHDGVRCIEWADRLEGSAVLAGEPCIHVLLGERGTGRSIEITFDDIALPSPERIDRWRADVRLPEHIVRHCEAVGAFARVLALHLADAGIVARPEALLFAGRVHDLLRFLDFRPDASPSDFRITEEDRRCWERWAQRHPGLRHEAACAAFLREQGYPALAAIVETHGLPSPAPERSRTEQQVLFYADKRVMIDRVVTLEERFQDFAIRYGNGVPSPDGLRWYDEAQAVERTLFPHGIPA